METTLSHLNLAWVNSGFGSDPSMQWVMDFCHWIVQVVIQPKEHKGFVLLPKRWVVKRTFGWD
ncbi:hypothetical protein [Nostoc sp.]|uniref:hypothetical protein n=1 Tax=Nostoc sp. TaxID=1180 RepID=UPI003FA5EB14